MPKYKFINRSGPATFPLSAVFVDKYMPEANATFVKVYLYGLRLCYSAGEDTDNAKIAEALDILETDVCKAYKYWESKGVVRVTEDGVEFMDLSSAAEPKKTKKPVYSGSELADIMRNNTDIKQLVNHAESIFGKTLSQSEMSTLLGFYDWLRLPIEVILLLLEHCASLQKTSMRYAEKVAVSWAENGIDTLDKAQEYLQNYDKREKVLRKFKRLFGVKSISDSEYAHIIQWTENMKMSHDLIKRAYEKALLVTGEASFPYMNGILQSWFKKGITETDDLSKDTPPIKPERKKQTPSKFTGYSQSGDYDTDVIEKKLFEKRKNEK